MAGDETIHRHNQKPDPPRQSRPGELLFEFHVERTHTLYRVELRDHGPVYGVEAQFLDPVDPRICRTFRADGDPSRARAMAIAWAEQERKAIENPLAGGHRHGGRQ